MFNNLVFGYLAFMTVMLGGGGGGGGGRGRQINIYNHT